MEKSVYQDYDSDSDVPDELKQDYVDEQTGDVPLKGWVCYATLTQSMLYNYSEYPAVNNINTLNELDMVVPICFTQNISEEVWIYNTFYASGNRLAHLCLTQVETSLKLLFS